MTAKQYIGFGHVLVTSRNSNVIRQVMVTCKSTSLTSDVGHLPVTSSYVTYYYYYNYLNNVT